MGKSSPLRWMLRAASWVCGALAIYYAGDAPGRAGVWVALAFVLLIDSRLPLPPDDPH